jgi:PhoPQ-activated pathogenicity-related protein
MKIIDPINSFDRLENIPKLIVVSSDDEFMQFDWPQLYWD